MGEGVSARQVLRDRSVAALLLTGFCSSTAAFCQLTALGKLVFDTTGRELDLGFLGLAEFAPAFLLVVVTGAVADRFDRRRILFVALLAEIAFAVALALVSASDLTGVAPILALVVGFGIARAFAAPASRALPANVVDEARFPRLVAFSSVSWQSASIVGPVLGGLLYAWDPATPYLATVSLLIVAAVGTTFIRLRPEAQARLDEAPQRPNVHEALEGLRVIRRNPILLGAISLDLFAVLFGGAVALLPAIAEERLGAGAVGLGWLRAAGGIGAAAVGLALAGRPIGRRLGRTLFAVVATFGAFTVVLGVTRTYWVAFLAMAALSAADAVSVFIRATLVPLATPDNARGRVLAVENVFIGASNELGAFESGVAGELLGLMGAVVLGGVASIAIASLWWVLFPALRDIDRFADVHDAVREPPPSPVPNPG